MAMAALVGVLDGRRWKGVLRMDIRFKTNIRQELIVSHRYIKQSVFGDRSDSLFFHNYSTMATHVRSEGLGVADSTRLDGSSPRMPSKAVGSNGNSPFFLPSSFACKKCSLKLATEPVITSCGHVFCWSCLYQSVSRGVGLLRGECPACQSAVDLFRPTRMVTPINLLNSNNENEAKLPHQGTRKRPSWVPPQPKGKTNSIYDTLPFYSLTNMQFIQRPMKVEPTKNFVKLSTVNLSSSTIKLRVNLGTMEKCSSGLRRILDQMNLAYDYGESPVVVNTTKESERFSFLLHLIALHHDLQHFLKKLVGELYSVSKELAIAAIETENEIKLATAKFCKDLAEIPSLPYTFSQVQTPTPVDNFDLELFVSSDPSGFWFKKPQALDFQSTFMRSLSRKLISVQQKQNLRTRTEAKGYFPSGFHTSAKGYSLSGFHTSATESTGRQILDSTNDMSKIVWNVNLLLENMFRTVSEAEDQINLLLDTVSSNRSLIVQDFDYVGKKLYSIMLGLLDGWQWWCSEPREEDIISFEKNKRWLNDYCKDWIEVVGRDFTDDLGPIYVEHGSHYLPDPPFTSKVPSFKSAMHTTFYCNVCGEVNDAIEEPVVTYCGHLFCWHCLCENAINRTIGDECFHGFCPVCNQTVDSGLGINNAATIVPVCGNTISPDDFCTSSEKPRRPVPKRLPISDLNKSIRLLCTTTKEITPLWQNIHTKAQKGKNDVDAIQNYIKPTLEHFHREISEKLENNEFPDNLEDVTKTAIGMSL